MTYDPRSPRCTPAGPMAVTGTTARWEETIEEPEARDSRGTAQRLAGLAGRRRVDSRRSFRRTLPRTPEHRRVLQLATPCVYEPLPSRFVLMLARPSRTLTLVY